MPSLYNEGGFLYGACCAVCLYTDPSLRNRLKDKSSLWKETTDNGSHNPRVNRPFLEPVCVITVYGFRHSSWWGVCVWCLYTHSSPWKGNESQIRSSGEDKGIDLYLQSMVRATAESLARSLLTIDGVCKMDTTTLCSCIFLFMKCVYMYTMIGRTKNIP